MTGSAPQYTKGLPTKASHHDPLYSVDNKQEKNSLGKNDRLGTAVYKGAAHEGFTPRSTLICGQ